MNRVSAAANKRRLHMGCGEPLSLQKGLVPRAGAESEKPALKLLSGRKHKKRSSRGRA